MLMAVLAIGCGERETRFTPDELLRARNGLTVEQSESIDAALVAWFGTPDEPALPESLPRLAGWLDADALKQAAGPVVSHEVGVTEGLYRRHCARCHGVTGDGRGPTARYQSPHPRDFRRGVFKWKRTARDTPPTAADLHATLERGVPGTAMPSFRLLSEDERDKLRQYVQYLALRGQAERALVDYVANELPLEEVFDPADEAFLASWLQPLTDEWIDAAPIAVDPQADSIDLQLGETLYHSERTGCFKCHGPQGQGGAVAGKDYEIDYDVWNRDRIVLKPSDAVRRLIEKDLPLRPSRPRRLVGRTPHGGSALADFVHRLDQGVAGTPMPALGGAGATFTEKEIVSLAAYARELMAVEAKEVE
ncbi:Cytochrome c [Planctomycetes bacterium MalM25]|nr:Cytochrome c [Planctomycetes bacterium MalM25]